MLLAMTIMDRSSETVCKPQLNAFFHKSCLDHDVSSQLQNSGYTPTHCNAHKYNVQLCLVYRKSTCRMSLHELSESSLRAVLEK